ncbi:MAG: hypothetical protein KC656_05250 [Myxococcales bacterium]|nr:hypothetical protein [Myxococcales bacterium]
MRWDIEEKVVAELWFFTGLSFSGTRRIARIHAYGGLQGDEIPGDEVRSMGIIANPGVRIILKTAGSDLAWEDMPWRCFQVLEGQTMTMQDGRTAIQVPDLDAYDRWDCNRADTELESEYPQVAKLSDGTTWTFGRSGRRKLKNNLKAIRVERIPG